MRSGRLVILVPQMRGKRRKLGIGSGVGLTMADMVGTGVLTTAGFMALELPPRIILLDWLIGGIVALAGVLAYSALARQVPRSGGEYRYLSAMLHPLAGYIAGWASLLVGFSVPVALAALAAGAFAETISPAMDSRRVAAGMIALLAGLHMVNLRTSKWAQDALAAIKALLLVAFIVIGLTLGTNTIPNWTPAAATDAGTTFPFAPFFTSLIFISFCYTGWNAATYASEEFERPVRDVPRSMLIGCTAVIIMYMLVNWVLVTNLSHADITGWIKDDTSRVTLAHLVMRNLLGSTGAKLMSVVVIIALMSAISSMTVIGPRIYSAMAGDRLLPSLFAAREGRPPVTSTLLQSGLAITLTFQSGFRELLNNVGSILAIVSALTALSLFRKSRWRPDTRPSTMALLGAAAYALMSGWMVYFALQSSAAHDIWGLHVPTVALWMGGIVLLATLAYAATRRLGTPATSDQRQ